MEYYDLDGSNFNFKGDDVLRMVNLRFHDLAPFIEVAFARRQNDGLFQSILIAKSAPRKMSCCAKEIKVAPFLRLCKTSYNAA